MKKIETVWCQLLFDALENHQNRFQQQRLAKKLKMSVSTVNHGLKDLRRMGAVAIGGGGGSVIDAEKILMHWANHRGLTGDTVSTIKLDGPVQEIEGLLPPGSILGGYSAVRHWYGEAPTDYSTAFAYHLEPNKIVERFTNQPAGNTNLVVLKLPPTLPIRPETTTLAHTFVDLWNLTDWMAKDFVRRVKAEIDELLS